MSLFRIYKYKLGYFCGESYCILYGGTAPVAARVRGLVAPVLPPPMCLLLEARIVCLNRASSPALRF